MDQKPSASDLFIKKGFLFIQDFLSIKIPMEK